MTEVQHIDDSALSINRVKKGNGFIFTDENQEKITDKTVLKRLKKLVIPPMWSDVMICRFDDGHIQAIGRDLKGRKQYIYHEDFIKQKQEEKFERLYHFGKKLPEIRKQCHQDLHIKGWGKEKVLALIILILDETGIRIGNKQYQNKNGTYGLTTLRRKHMTVEDEELIFSYKGKSNKHREVHIDDDELMAFIKKSAEQPGYEIFRYKGKDGKYHDVDSDEVNEFISEFMKGDFSSKDFRTWVASRLAIELYPEALNYFENSKKKKFSNLLIKMVADELGNTPTVCRDYYVHPKIIDRIENRAITVAKMNDDLNCNYELSPSEQLLLNMIK